MAFSLKDYEILDEIGSGSFGSVFRARQKSLGRIVAIKCLQPQRAQDRHDIIRFRREAQAMAALNHDNIISVLDYAFFSGNYYIVMEYVEGGSMEEAISNGLGLLESIAVLHKVSDALRCAHAHQVVHHDIKPGNILLGKNGQVKLADFGLASFQQEISQQSSMISAVGTLAYMAPEAMVNPKDADTRVDIFSFGTVLYQVLSGRLPFPGESIGEISYMILNNEPAPLVVPSQWQPVADLAMSCLAKDRDKRPSADHVHSVLTDIIGANTHTAREGLASFFGSGAPRTKAAPPPIGPEMKHKGFRWPSKVLVGSSIAAAVLVAGIAAFVLQRESDRTTPLPRLVTPDGTELLSDAAFGASPESSPSSASLDLEFGAVLVQGLRPSDSLYINGKLTTIPSRGGAIAFPLSPGESRLEVRSQGETMTTELTIAPRQLITWDFRAEGSAR